MAWIESHQDLARHPKTIRLAKRLGISVRDAIGCLHLLWWWALDYADHGDLSGFDADEIAAAMLWDGDAESLLEALRYARFLDDDGCIHDWEQYTGKLVERRVANAKRMRQARAEQPSSIKDARAQNVHSTCPESAEPPDQTRPDQPDQTNRTRPDQPEAANAARPTQKAIAAEIFDYYRERIQPGAREPATEKITTRLKKWTAEELRAAIENFSADWWWMENNGRQGAAWFFDSDRQIERFINLIPRTESEHATADQRSNGRNGSAPGTPPGTPRRDGERDYAEASKSYGF